MIGGYSPGKINVLDGGFATELERNGFNFTNDPLWSARALHTNPEAVCNVHKSYLSNGADIITTASYQASVSGFQKYLGLTVDQSIDLIKLSVGLAKQASEELRKTYSFKDDKNIQIAGSVGPYGACLADGSEYTGDYCDHLSVEELAEWHRPRIQYLIEAGVDVLALETIPAAKEGEALLKILREFPSTKAWLSFSCQSLHQTAHKEDISTAVNQCLKSSSANQLIAIGVNCCPPDYAESLLKDIASVTHHLPLIVYPNSGEKWKSGIGWVEDRKPFHAYINKWVNTAAKIIGGCCRTTPEDISRILQCIQNMPQ